MWRYAAFPVNCYLQQKRLSGVTLIGVVSSKTGKAYVDATELGTTKKSVSAFLEKLLPKHRGAVLVMDNHPAHSKKELQPLATKYGIELAFLPSISSNLNPIGKSTNPPYSSIFCFFL